ncbi:MAG: hypothetical protein Q7S52_02850, partial [bacterium]|nr:hypothetical protein [bacterium]
MTLARENFFRNPNFRFHRGIVIEHIFSRHYRAWVTATTGTVVLVYLIATATSHYYAGAVLKEYFAFPPDTTIANGVFLIALAVFLTMKMLKCYSRSYYYYVEGLLERGKSGAQTSYTTPNYEVCNAYYETKEGDLLKGFCFSTQGKRVLRRLGISDESMRAYLEARNMIVDFRERTAELKEVYTLSDLAQKLLASDPDFYQFLFGLGVRERELLGAAEWVERMTKRKKQRERFWGKIALGAISPL